MKGVGFALKFWAAQNFDLLGYTEFDYAGCIAV